MSDTTEPLADILAEMRDQADHRAADAGGERPGIELLRSYADRIEAAAERERSAHTNDIHDALYKATGIPGNAAATRDALVKIVNLAPEYPANDVDWNALAAEAFLTASAALAAPARNVDRFQTAEEAVAAFADHLRAWENAHGVYSEYPDHPVKVPAGAFAWLFDKAEGGNE